MRKLWILNLFLPYLAILTGCQYDFATAEACSIDPEQCSYSSNGWATYGDCAVVGDLQVNLGDGESSYVPLATGILPQTHQATGLQGGGSSHFWGAIQIVKPDAQRHKFRVEFNACSGEKLQAQQQGLPTAADCDGVLSSRVAVLDTSLVQAPDGSLSRAGIQVFLRGELHWARVEVRDQCGRIANDQRP